MKICPNCQSQMADEAKFCKQCGTNVQGIAPFVQQPVMQAPVSHCMKCGGVLNPGAKFCTKCGTPTSPVAPFSSVQRDSITNPVRYADPNFTSVLDDDEKTQPIPSAPADVVFAVPETATVSPVAPVADEDDDRTLPITAVTPEVTVTPAEPAAVDEDDEKTLPITAETPAAPVAIDEDDEKTLPITAETPAAPQKEDAPAAPVVDEDDDRTVLPSLFKSEPRVQEAVKKAEAQKAAAVSVDDDDDDDDRTVPMASQPVPVIPQNGPKCPACGNPVQPGMMFCNHCGAKLEPINANPYAGAPASVSSNAQEQKKGGSKVLIIVAVILIAALLIGGIAAITLGGKNGDDKSGFNLPSFSQNKDEKEAAPETETAAPETESEVDELAPFYAQVESGDYRAVIDSFVSGEGASVTGRDADVKALVKSALDGEENAFTGDIWNNYAANGNYADAYARVEEEKAYFTDVANTFEDAKTNVENLDGLISALRTNHYYLFVDQASEAVKNSDENALNFIMEEAASFFEGSDDFGDAFASQRSSSYAELILHTAISVHSSGNQVDTVNYIFDHIEEGNYHFYMMELYEDSANALGLFSYAASVTQLPNRGDYIFENSDTVLLTDADLSGKDLNTVRVALHEIYARHGRTFTNGAIQAYFDSKGWYTRLGSNSGDIHFDENALSETEKENVKTIVQYMIQKGFFKRAN